MAKHSIGDTVSHSRHGAGVIKAVKQVMETPPAFDAVKLDGELWNLRARISEIEAIKARGTDPRPVDKYEVLYPDAGCKCETPEPASRPVKSDVQVCKTCNKQIGGRVEGDVSEYGIDRLKARLVTADDQNSAPPSE